MCSTLLHVPENKEMSNDVGSKVGDQTPFSVFQHHSSSSNIILHVGQTYENVEFNNVARCGMEM